MRTKSENAKAENEVLNGLQPVVEMADAVKGIEPAASQQPEINPFGTSETGSFEIAPGMTVEEIKAEFFNEDALQEQPEPVYRLDSSGHRYYYTFDENGEPIFYVSVTTLIKQTLPTSPQLIKWIADMGYEESQRYAQERAAYGTFMHSQLAELLIARSYNLNGLKERLKMYIESEQLPGDFINYADDFKKDILAFAQFMKDTDLKPLAIELVLTNPQDGYAGAIDLCAEITIEEKGFFGDVYKTGANAGKPKETKRQRRIRAIIDFKSGRKGFFPEHEVQLLAYKTMWNMHFEKYPVEKVFNWSPKDWRGTTPTYNFKDQTESKNAQKLPYLVELARIEDEKRDNTIVACAGIIDLDKPDFENNITELSLAEVVKKRKQKTEEKPETGIEPEEIASAQGTTVEEVIAIIQQGYFNNLFAAEDNLPEDVRVIVEAQRINNHRWYSTAQMIVKCTDGYVSICGAYQSFSEMQSWSDINVICSAGAIPQEESAVYDAMIKARESRNKANEAKMKPTESEKPQMGTDVPKKKEKPVKPKKTAKDKQKENISALLNGDDEL